MLHSNYQSHNLIGRYHFWVMSLRNLTLFTLFLASYPGLFFLNGLGTRLDCFLLGGMCGLRTRLPNSFKSPSSFSVLSKTCNSCKWPSFPMVVLPLMCTWHSVQQYVRTAQYSDMWTLLNTLLSTVIWGHCSVQRYVDTTQYTTQYSDMGTLLSTAICGHYSVQRYGDTTQYSDMGTLLSTAIYGH